MNFFFRLDNVIILCALEAMPQDVDSKDQRIRDPVHDLVAFSGSDEFEQLIWRLLNAREFQRLRRVKQLGLSELVYPGATHTRFSHSVGVFHTARSLLHVLRLALGQEFSQNRANAAVCAALLHDVGHGPFSHAFESIEKARGASKKHEKWTTEIIKGTTEIGRILSEYDEGLRERVAALLEEEYPSDIYSSIVSSQFDADRLDYLRRDKLMTGTEYGGFDWAWLLHNLEVEKLTIGGEEGDTPIEVEGLILGSKGLRAAEGYLLGRFHLYTQVYMHKTTRAAEKMLGALLTRLDQLISNGDGEKTGLPKLHPLRLYLKDGGNTLENYHALDDFTVWGCLPLLKHSTCPLVVELSTRLNDRNVYKCLDVGALSEMIGGDVKARFRRLLSKATFDDIDVLEDRATVSPYKFREYESSDALSKILIRKANGSGQHEDVANISPVIGAMREKQIFRVYARGTGVMDQLLSIWKEATR